MSSTRPRELFLEAVRSHPDVRADAKRFESLLKDYYQGNYRKESAVLSNCVREGVPDTLASVKGGAPYAVASAPVVRRLVDNWGTTEEIARWAVDSWAIALDIVKETDLRPRIQSLSIVSDPPGAKAIVDGQSVGTTPIEVKPIAPGTHRVECTRDGYVSATASVAIAGGERAKLSLTLQRQTPPPTPVQDTATFVVISEPPGAEVYLDDQHLGQAPLKITGVSPGSHVIRCTLSGYSDQSVTSFVRALEERHHKLALRPLAQQFAEINILSTPPGCAVHLDDTYVGLSPLRIEKVTAGHHIVKCLHAGYEEEQRSIDVAPGTAYRVNVVLDPVIQHVYEIAIASRPSRATLYVNQAKVGETPYTLTTAQSGSVSIVCTYPGYRTWRQDLTIGPGLPNSLAITLEPEERRAKKSDSAKRMPPLMPRPLAIVNICSLSVLISGVMGVAGLVSPLWLLFSIWGFVGAYYLNKMKKFGFHLTASWAGILIVFLGFTVLSRSAVMGIPIPALVAIIIFVGILMVLGRYRSYFFE